MEYFTLRVGEPGWARRVAEQQEHFGISYHAHEGDYRGMRQHESLASDRALQKQLLLIDTQNKERFPPLLEDGSVDPRWCVAWRAAALAACAPPLVADQGFADE